MKKYYILIFFVFCSILANAQSFISKMYCKSNYYYGIYDTAIQSDNTILAAGQIVDKKAGSLSPTYHFIAKFNPNGDLIWIKKLQGLGLVAHIKLSTLSNNSFLLNIQGVLAWSFGDGLYCFDKEANLLWSKKNILTEQFADLPSKKAFIIKNSGLLLKIDYDGAIQWQNSLLSSKNDYVINTSLEKETDDAFYVAGNLINDPASKVDSLILLKLNTSDGTISSQHSIWTTNKDSLTINALNIKNGSITLGGEIISTLNNNPVGVLINLNANKTINFAKELKADASKSRVNSIHYVNNALIINMLKYESADYNFILSKVSLAGNIDSSIYYFYGQFYGYSQMPIALSNNGTLYHFHDVNSGGINFISATEKFSFGSCKSQNAAVISSSITLNIKKTTVMESISVTNPYEKAELLPTFSNWEFETYNRCPECSCPTITEKKATICKGEKYKLLSGKIVMTEGVHIDTIKNILNDCENYQKTEIKLIPLKTNEKKFTLCAAPPHQNRFKNLYKIRHFSRHFKNCNRM